MSIQSIIDRAQQIEIDRRRMISQSVSRSQRIKTAERSTTQPWKFRVTPSPGLSWADNRGVIEVITLNDRVNEYQISLNNNPRMNFITEYQGDLNQSQLNALTISSVGTQTITLTTLPSVSSSTVLFQIGDFIQPENSRYPYSVTSEVTRGTSTVTNVTLNRPVITSEGITLVNHGVVVGNSCTWRVIVSSLPTFTLVPIKRVQFTGDFELIEKVI